MRAQRRPGFVLEPGDDVDELRELLIDAWRMCVPKKVAAAYEG